MWELMLKERPGCRNPKEGMETKLREGDFLHRHTAQRHISKHTHSFFVLSQFPSSTSVALSLQWDKIYTQRVWLSVLLLRLSSLFLTVSLFEGQNYVSYVHSSLLSCDVNRSNGGIWRASWISVTASAHDGPPPRHPYTLFLPKYR